MEIYNELESFCEATAELDAACEGFEKNQEDEETLLGYVDAFLRARDYLQSAKNRILAVYKDGDNFSYNFLKDFSEKAKVSFLEVSDDNHTDVFLAGTDESFLDELYQKVHLNGNSVKYTHADGIVKG